VLPVASQIPGRLKIFHVVYSLGVGGLENGVVNVINRLDPDRFTHTVCCLTRSGNFARRIGREKVEILELGFDPNSFRFPLVTLSRLFRRHAPHVVHTRGWGAIDAVFAARLAGVPKVIHGEHGREWNDKDGTNWKRNQIRRLVGLLVDRYVVVCHFFREWLRETCKVHDDKSLHIPDGVDTTMFYPLVRTGEKGLRHEWEGKGNRSSLLSPQHSALSSDIKALRESLGLPAGGTLLGTVGRLDPVKDLTTLLRGFAVARARFPEARLALVGDGPLRRELTNLASDLGISPAVCWLGERENIPSLLRCFDLFVQTSLFEGMSNTILEAMATGLPIIPTQAGGNGELVADEENGALIQVGDIAALGRSLEIYLEKPELRRLHGSRSREKIVQQFDLSLMASRYATLYETVVRDG